MSGGSDVYLPYLSFLRRKRVYAVMRRIHRADPDIFHALDGSQEYRRLLDMVRQQVLSPYFPTLPHHADGLTVATIEKASHTRGLLHTALRHIFQADLTQFIS